MDDMECGGKDCYGCEECAIRECEHCHRDYRSAHSKDSRIHMCNVCLVSRAYSFAEAEAYDRENNRVYPIGHPVHSMRALRRLSTGGLTITQDWDAAEKAALEFLYEKGKATRYVHGNGGASYRISDAELLKMRDSRG